MSVTAYVALAAAALCVLTMPLYAVVTRHRPLDADVAQRPKTALLGYWIRDWLIWVIAPIERALVRANASPDLFNYLGVAFGAAAGVAYARRSLALGGWLVLLGGLADVFDGRIARARGLVSRRGEFLDSMLDRFAETFTYVGLALYFERMRWAMLATLSALGGSLLVSYARAKGQGVGVLFRGGIMQRAERLVLLAIASLLDGAVAAAVGTPPGVIVLGAVAVIGLGSFGTAVYRTAQIARALGGQAPTARVADSSQSTSRPELPESSRGGERGAATLPTSRHREG
jgi:CDP-diacylglycerol---glycerol-3-phosphate 3-phosphatidyltransferase